MRQPDTKRVLLSSFFESNRLPFALALVFSLLSAGCNLFVSWLLGAVVDPPYLNQPGTDFPFFFLAAF